MLNCQRTTVSPTQYKHSYGPNAIRISADWISDFRSIRLIRSGDDRAVEQLLRAQANPIRADKGQEAPLQLAVRVGAPSYVRLLLQYRAVPLRPAGVCGSAASVNEKKEDMARIIQIASSTPASVAILEMAHSEPPLSAAQGR